LSDWEEEEEKEEDEEEEQEEEEKEEEEAVMKDNERKRKRRSRFRRRKKRKSTLKPTWRERKDPHPDVTAAVPFRCQDCTIPPDVIAGHTSSLQESVKKRKMMLQQKNYFSSNFLRNSRNRFETGRCKLDYRSRGVFGCHW
jgi:hypothetical protein